MLKILQIESDEATTAANHELCMRKHVNTSFPKAENHSNLRINHSLISRTNYYFNPTIQQSMAQSPLEAANSPSVHPISLSFPLPKAPETRLHIQLTIHKTSILLFLTTCLSGDISTTAPLGSFVYALPDVSIHPFLSQPKVKQ